MATPLIPNDILSHLVEWLVSRSNLLREIDYLAHLGDDGTIYIPMKPGSNEFRRAGLADNRDNFGYIRYRNVDGSDWNLEPHPGKSFSSCVERYIVTQNLRLVTVISGGPQPEIWADKIINDLIGFFPQDRPAYKAIRCTPRSATLDPFQITSEETGKAATSFPVGLVFTAFDFVLSFEYLYDKCKRLAVGDTGGGDQLQAIIP